MKQIFLATLLACSTSVALAEAPVYDMINLEASAQESVANDLMQATLFVELDNKDSRALAAEMTRTLNQAMKAAQGFRSVKAATGAQSTWPIHDAKNRLVSWRARAEIRLESRDFDAIAGAIAQMQNGMQLGGVSFALAPETANSRANALIDTAMAAFRVRADLVAKALGANSWKVVNLNVNTSNNRPPMPYMRAMAMKADGAEEMPVQDVAGGESDINVMLNGTIQLQR